MTKSLLVPIGIVAVWALLITGLSTSFGSWDNTQAAMAYLLQRFNPDLSNQLSPQALSRVNFVIRKLAHFSEYAVLFSLAYWMSRMGFKLAKAIALPLVLACVVLFAVSDEVHQSFVPGRTPHVRDVLIDSSGAAMAAILALRFDRSPAVVDDTVRSE